MPMRSGGTPAPRKDGDGWQIYNPDTKKWVYSKDPNYRPGNSTVGERNAQAEIERLKAEQAAMPQLSPYQGTSTDGVLNSNYRTTANVVDASTFQQISPWTQMAMDKQAIDERNALDLSGRQQSTGLAQARNNLSMRGGLSSGAAERLAAQGADSLLTSQQGSRNQGMLARANIGMQGAALDTDIAKFNMGAKNTTDQFNMTNNINDLTNQNEWNKYKYGEEMKLMGAKETSKATSSGGGNQCCFIFLEARYGNGTMDRVVRRFRDENLTDRNRRGYYKLSEVLVPAMRKSKFVKLCVRVFLTDPTVSYLKWYYEGKGIGRIFSPVVRFWLKAFDHLGLDHQYVRENGEVV